MSLQRLSSTILNKSRLRFGLAKCHTFGSQTLGSQTLGSQTLITLWHRKYSSPATSNDDLAFLDKPSWSVRSLLPPEGISASNADKITPTALHHLLRLAALPPPSTPEEESKMLSDLSAQLHFVKHMQSVDITGIEPLQMLRDETIKGEYTFEEILEAAGVKEEELQTPGIGEEKLGLSGAGTSTAGVGDSGANGPHLQGDYEWDVLGMAQKKLGRYFVVDEQVQEPDEGNDEVEGGRLEEKKKELVDIVDQKLSKEEI